MIIEIKYLRIRPSSKKLKPSYFNMSEILEKKFLQAFISAKKKNKHFSDILKINVYKHKREEKMDKKNIKYLVAFGIFMVACIVIILFPNKTKEVEETKFNPVLLKDPSSNNEIEVYEFIDDDDVTTYKDSNVSKLMTSKDNVMVSYMLIKADNPDPEKQIYASVSDYISQSMPDKCVISEGSFSEGFYAKAVTDNALPEPVSIVFAAKRVSQNSLLAVRIVLASGYDKDTASEFFEINHITCPENAIRLDTTSSVAEAVLEDESENNKTKEGANI